MDHRSGCLICGEELSYQPERQARACALCGVVSEADAHCRAGHFVCDGCHEASALDLIEQVCARSESTDAVGLAAELMRSPRVHMHGPEHHFLVPAVLIAAAANAAGDARKARWLAEARKRSGGVPGGTCGFWGACGAGVGAGLAVSVLTQATPLSKAEWRLANRMTAMALEVIAAHGGPRCCKRDAFLALREAVGFLRAELGFTTLAEAGEVRCAHSAMNRECLKAECPFYGPR